MCACTSLEAGLMWFGELWWWFGGGLGWFGGGLGGLGCLYEISEYPPPPTGVQNCLNITLFLSNVDFVFQNQLSGKISRSTITSSRSGPMFLSSLMVWVETVCFRLSTDSTSRPRSRQRVRPLMGFRNVGIMAICHGILVKI